MVQPQSATLLCNATAQPRPQITWWRMGNQLMTHANKIEISRDTLGERETVSNLTIIMADPSDAGGYVCLATNAAGQDNTTAEFIVHGKSVMILSERTVIQDLHLLSCSHTQHHLPSGQCFHLHCE